MAVLYQAGLSLIQLTRTFNGTPTNADVGAVSLKITASDRALATVEATLTLTVENTNDAPTLTAEIADQSINENSPFNLTLAANTFSDIDVGDTLTYSVTLADGSALSTWLSFNAATRIFSGTPGISDSGFFNIKVTASDTQGATADDIFSLSVINLINGNSANNTLSGTSKADSLNGFAGDDYLEGLADDDLIDGGTGKLDRLFGGEGNDTLTDPDGANGAHGGTGNDIIDVTFAATWDNDTHSTNAPRSDGKITGGYGDDLITITMNNSRFFINLKGDEPTSSVSDGNDLITLLGSYQNSVVALGGGNDRFTGGIGSDNVSGGAGNDLLVGNSGNDILTGDTGNDTLMGGAGSDTLTGGLGQDQFVYTNLLDSGDSLKGFQVREDKIVLSELMDNLGYGGNNPIADSYVRLIQGNTGTSVQVDPDGQAGSGVFRPFILLENVSVASLSANDFVF